MGEIHELFVLALSLVWFAGATPDKNATDSKFTMGSKFPVSEGLRHTTYLVSPNLLPLAICDFSKGYRENGHSERTRFKVAIFPVSRGKNRISQGVEDWGSLLTN